MRRATIACVLGLAFLAFNTFAHLPVHLPVHSARTAERESSIPRSPHRRTLIEQGWLAQTSDYPYAAMVVRPEDTRYLCTGTLIHPRVVLTAAHCVTPALDGRVNPIVQLGREGPAQKVDYEQYNTRSYVHPRFHPGSFDYDIAALVLDRPTTTIPARLVPVGATLGVAPSDANSDAPYQLWRQLSTPPSSAGSFPSLDLIVLGWGSTGSGGLPNTLQQGRVTPIALDQCQASFKEFGSRVTRRMVCVTGKTCAGDSGGPLLLPSQTPDHLLVGQVSFGYPRRNNGDGCPRPNPVTAFTDLSAPHIRDWLQQNILDRVDGNSMQQQSGGADGSGYADGMYEPQNVDYSPGYGGDDGEG